ncbi:NAD(P)-dependent oxidoreductase [Pseudoalteromonas rubra]|uniref:NAD(P)-dependent oxidoreductase n=1 Tax=Pseudoalteromonas rubra TaxID=43658 RepID=A0A5S3WMW1_9GAMM|nr:NAD(P)-dependent oxidoreductase [Pseudoalteromonas rubra]TMP28193.1 NAD(P)-dependent oxidoreductase [Pseudoalteromonas rubra]TMP34895.1 NAD(P)-dependent oxidoreductase [Pseudoalteromonas rubra]
MKVLVTGSAGRVGRAIYIKLMREYEVVGLDKTPCSTADFVGDIRDSDLLNEAVEGIDVVVHTAALHAPHVGLVDEDMFQFVNVEATKQLALAGVQAGVKHFVFTSTTALYGHASTPSGRAGWITEHTVPQPKSAYHRSKILAEQALHTISTEHSLPVTVLQMSRCFPEPADLMAIYRLTRGIDARDVATAHLCAIQKRLTGFRRFIISGATPFNRADCERLYQDAPAVIAEKCPDLVSAFKQRNWSLPKSLDRVYDSSAVRQQLQWQPTHDFNRVLEMLDTETAEVLPCIRGRSLP